MKAFDCECRFWARSDLTPATSVNTHHPGCPNNILHVYTDENGVDTVIAYDEQDAKLVWEETTGTKWDEEFDANEGFVQRDDDDELSIYMDEDCVREDANLTKMTCKEWAKQEGRCFLCSTEY